MAGGVANAGGVVRVGPHVLRPGTVHSGATHGFLTALHDDGFRGASQPVGIDPDGRERLVYIEGDVAIPPFPEWVQTDHALASIAALMADFHAASRRVSSRLDRTGWSEEMADPLGGPVICHNDVCLENVVFRDGEAVGLLDFDFAAPGRPVYDLGQFARMCVPIDDDVNAAKLGWHPAELPGRLRLVADTCGLDAAGRVELIEVLAHSMVHGGEFVRRRAELGDPNFIAMLADMGGMERYDRRRRWWDERRHAFGQALR